MDRKRRKFKNIRRLTNKVTSKFKVTWTEAFFKRSYNISGSVRAIEEISVSISILSRSRIKIMILTLIDSWKKTYVKGKGGKNDPKTKIAVTSFLLKIY